MSNDFHDECAARFGLVGIRMAEALQALDNLAELGRLLVASDDAELDDDARGALDAATRRAMHSTVELLAAGVASPLRDTIEAELHRPAPAPWSAWQRDQDDRLVRDLVGELQDASTIIGNALALMTPAQKLQWAEANDRDGCSGEGTTRANEREAVLARAREARS